MECPREIVEAAQAAAAKHPEDIPAEWAQSGESGEEGQRRIADFIAGMTDRYALVEHARLFDVTPILH